LGVRELSKSSSIHCSKILLHPLPQILLHSQQLYWGLRRCPNGHFFGLLGHIFEVNSVSEKLGVDSKVFPGSEDNVNVRRILIEVLISERILQELVMNSIKLVCSTPRTGPTPPTIHTATKYEPPPPPPKDPFHSSTPLSPPLKTLL